MPVQMIELEEVQMMHVSDDALEAAVSAGGHSYTVSNTECF